MLKTQADDEARCFKPETIDSLAATHEKTKGRAVSRESGQGGGGGDGGLEVAVKSPPPSCTDLGSSPLAYTCELLRPCLRIPTNLSLSIYLYPNTLGTNQFTDEGKKASAPTQRREKRKSTLEWQA